MAAVATDLNSSLVRQLFFLIYPEPVCAPMAGEFVQIVNAAGQAERRRAASEPAVQWCAAVA